MIQNFRFYVQDRQIGLAKILGCHFENRDDGTAFKQAGYVILSIASAYFEMIQQFIDGRESVEEDGNGKLKSHSWDFFKRGFKEVYPDPQWTDASIKKIYRVVRCGMYHGGMPKVGCHLSRYFQPGFHLCRNEIHVNPAAVVREIGQHFERYMQSLKIDQARQANFVAMCRILGLDQTAPDHTYCDTPGGTRFTPTTPNPAAKGNEPLNWKVETEQ
ncbi:MAG: hypothetical protein HY040_21050 [Planctomycetes bacterium]|nr:hypothetical protein [Planctomycetota bacterium]